MVLASQWAGQDGVSGDPLLTTQRLCLFRQEANTSLDRKSRHLLSKMSDQEAVPSFSEGDICPLGASPAQSEHGALLSGHSSPHSGKSQLGIPGRPVTAVCDVCSAEGKGAPPVRAALPGRPRDRVRLPAPRGHRERPGGRR